MQSVADTRSEAHARHDRTALFVAFSGIAVVAAFALYLWTLSPPEVPDFGGAAHVLPVAVALPPFSLVDHRGETFDRSRLEGRWSLLFFGYTYCPDVCPTTLQSLAGVREEMDAAKEAPVVPPQMVFVSVDPARDSRERLAEYVDYFHPALLGASGEPGQVERLSGAVGAFHRQAESDRAGDYLVDHSSSLFLVDPEARLHAVLHEPEDPAAFVDLLARVQAFERRS